jgi:hypothetical protein
MSSAHVCSIIPQVRQSKARNQRETKGGKDAAKARNQREKKEEKDAAKARNQREKKGKKDAADKLNGKDKAPHHTTHVPDTPPPPTVKMLREALMAAALSGSSADLKRCLVDGFGDVTAVDQVCKPRTRYRMSTNVYTHIAARMRARLETRLCTWSILLRKRCS